MVYKSSCPHAVICTISLVNSSRGKAASSGENTSHLIGTKFSYLSLNGIQVSPQHISLQDILNHYSFIAWIVMIKLILHTRFISESRISGINFILHYTKLYFKMLK